MSPTRLLLIEDDTAFANIEAALMVDAAKNCRWSAQVVHVHTWSEGVVTAKEFDAILLDLDLPDSGTQETLERLALVSAHLPPVIVVTGSDFDSIRHKSFRAGAQDFLWRGDVTVKPVECFQRIMHAIWRAEHLRKEKNHAA